MDSLVNPGAGNRTRLDVPYLVPYGSVNIARSP